MSKTATMRTSAGTLTIELDDVKAPKSVKLHGVAAHVIPKDRRRQFPGDLSACFVA